MSDDPSLVDSGTLAASCRRDIGEARARLIEAWRFLDGAVVSLWELEGRHYRGHEPPRALGHVCEACGGSGVVPDGETGSYAKGREP